MYDNVLTLVAACGCLRLYWNLNFAPPPSSAKRQLGLKLLPIKRAASPMLMLACFVFLRCSYRLHGLEENVEVCIVYVESWLRGNGCIPVNFKMEDAATAEISRAQVSEIS